MFDKESFLRRIINKTSREIKSGVTGYKFSPPDFIMVLLRQRDNILKVAIIWYNLGSSFNNEF